MRPHPSCLMQSPADNTAVTMHLRGTKSSFVLVCASGIVTEALFRFDIHRVVKCPHNVATAEIGRTGGCMINSFKQPELQ